MGGQGGRLAPLKSNTSGPIQTRKVVKKRSKEKREKRKKKKRKVKRKEKEEISEKLKQFFFFQILIFNL